MTDTTLTTKEAHLAAEACVSQAEHYEDTGDGMADCEPLYEAAEKLFMIAGDEVRAAHAREKALYYYGARMEWEENEKRLGRADEED